MLSRPMLTVHEVADLLKVKESTVRAWIHDNSLRAVKFGRDWRVAYKDLEAFTNARANRAPDAVEERRDRGIEDRA
ncbi:MAG: excisionase family DNA-binding protein [Alphaproteobacteria bacterium]|nr:excisionase family DNA-binding protein [Alphaproteobacteria bacterium]